MEWINKALKELEHKEGVNLEIESKRKNKFTASTKDGYARYRVYKNLDVANKEAIKEAKKHLKDHPEAYPDYILEQFAYITETDKRAYAQEEARLQLEPLTDQEIFREAELLHLYTPYDRDLSPEKVREDVEMAYAEELMEIAERNPLEFAIEELRYSTVSEAIEEGLLHIDYDEASERLVMIEGAGHFLSPYDGTLFELPNGFFVARVD